MSNLYFLGKDILEMGLSEGQFYATKLARDAFNILVGAKSQLDKNSAFRLLVETRRLTNLHQVRFVGDPQIEFNGYSVDLDSGIVTVKIAAIPVKIRDNAFIEAFLHQIFGPHKAWFKRYLALYTYTNYQRLPTPVFFGPRGTFKSTCSQMTADIYPGLSIV